ncbi:MAG: lysophospholipid acyltransferase family protein [Chitinophagales bacterium]
MIATWILKILIYPVSWLPLPILYLLGKLLAWNLQYVFRYRKKVVMGNLAIAFPEKTIKEHKKIASKFYQYLGAIVIESIKSFTISEKEISKRCKVLNPSILDTPSYADKNVIFMYGHYQNWEWSALGCNTQSNHKTAGIYKAIANKSMNDWIKSNRSRMGARLISMKEIKSVYENPPDEVFANAFISDQKPRDPKRGHWVDFFGIKTSFLAGAARYAKQYNLPIFFIDIQQPKKGHYTYFIEEMVPNPSEWDEKTIIETFANRLEKQIKENPAYWLWSHKKWQHKYEESK